MNKRTLFLAVTTILILLLFLYLGITVFKPDIKKISGIVLNIQNKPTFSVNTNTNTGEIQFLDLPSGSYLTAVSSLLMKSGETVPKDIPNATSINNITLRTTPVTLSGRITDYKGNPITNLVISLVGHTSRQIQFHTTTGPNGEYQLRILPDQYLLDLILDPHEDNKANMLPYSYNLYDLPLKIIKDKNLDLIIPIITVSGTVTDRNQNPLPGVRIEAYQDNDIPSGNRERAQDYAQTDDNGSYRLFLISNLIINDLLLRSPIESGYMPTYKKNLNLKGDSIINFTLQ